MNSQGSRLPGFFHLSPQERLELIQTVSNLDENEIRCLQHGDEALPIDDADKMVENVVGTFSLPLGIATNFHVNGRDVLIPMVVEEPSIIAGTSYAAKLTRAGGGFQATHTESLMIGQIQLIHVPDPHAAQLIINEHKGEILSLANQQSLSIKALGGGAQDLELTLFPSVSDGAMLIVNLIVDCCDAMGANIVNSMAEAAAPALAALSGGEVGIRVLSNLSDRRLACARVVVPPEVLARRELSGENVIERILLAQAFAMADPYRATTHNKGILNGIDPVLIATGNDWRAVDAGAHAYASRNNHYSPLSSWECDSTGNLVGSLELPMAVGIVGGATKAHPTARISLKILGVKSAGELAGICACVGLSSNLASLIALTTEGIQRGHMRLHARQIALSSGAKGVMVDEIAQMMVNENTIKLARAKELLAKLEEQGFLSNGDKPGDPEYE